MTAEDLASHYGLNAKRYRRELRAEGPAWHSKHQRWMVEAGSLEEAQLVAIAKKMKARG